MIFTVLAMAAIALGADNTPGTWKFNTAKSKQASGVSPITNATLVREAADGGVKYSVQGVRADGSKIDVSYTAKYTAKRLQRTAPPMTPPPSSR